MAAPSQRGHRGDSRSGATAGVNIAGLAELRKALRQLDDGPAWTRELGRLHREIAKRVAAWASFEASAAGGPYAHFAAMIKGRGSATGARLQIDSTANATFWGAKKRTGWNARNPNSRQQHPDWVGNSWDVGVHGQGPYVLNPTVADHLPEIERMVLDGIEDLTNRAFPD